MEVKREDLKLSRSEISLMILNFLTNVGFGSSSAIFEMESGISEHVKASVKNAPPSLIIELLQLGASTLLQEGEATLDLPSICERIQKIRLNSPASDLEVGLNDSTPEEEDEADRHPSESSDEDSLPATPAPQPRLSLQDIPDTFTSLEKEYLMSVLPSMTHDECSLILSSPQVARSLVLPNAAFNAPSMSTANPSPPLLEKPALVGARSLEFNDKPKPQEDNSWWEVFAQKARVEPKVEPDEDAEIDFLNLEASPPEPVPPEPDPQPEIVEAPLSDPRPPPVDELSLDLFSLELPGFKANDLKSSVNPGMAAHARGRRT